MPPSSSSSNSVDMTPFSSSFFEMASSSSSSVEMVDLTQDLTADAMEDTGIQNKQQPKRMKEKALASGGLQGAQEEEECLVSLPASSFEATQERGLVISAAARKMILQMALGQSVSTSIVKDGYKSIFLLHFLWVEKDSKQIQKHDEFQSGALV